MRCVRFPLALTVLSLAAAAQEFPQAVALVQRIDQTYPWLNVISSDVDAHGNVYLAGSPLGALRAAINIRIGPLGGRDIIVVKLDTAGRWIYGTAIGGSQDDGVVRIKADAGGNVYLAGGTSSGDYPAVSSPGSGAGAVVLKLDATGNVLFNASFTWAQAILSMDVDAGGIMTIGGIPRAGALPVSPGAYRASPDGSGGFIARINPAGTQADAATYIEGPVSNVAMRANGDVLFSMGTTIASLNASLSQLVFSTLTNLNGNIAHIGLDGSNNIYVAVPATVQRYAPDGGQLLWTRDLLPGSFTQFAVTAAGTSVLVGNVPPNYPTLNGTQACRADLQQPISGVTSTANGFLMALGPDGGVRYATFMAEDTPVYWPMTVSVGDGKPYALTQAFLALDGHTVRWEGIVSFDLDDLPLAHTSAECLLNSATLLISPIAPGTIMALLGERLGPQTGTSFALQDGHVPFDISGTSVTVDGKPAPMLYAQDGQINFIAPWSLRTDGSRVPVCVQMLAASSCLYAPTALVSPGLFVVNSQLAAINQDGTVNSAQNPARAGSYVSVYFTGAGQLDGAVVDGGVAGLNLQRDTAAVAASFTTNQCEPFSGCFGLSLDAPVLFIGAAPTLVYGVNVIIVPVPAQFSFSFPQTAQFTLRLRATPQSAVAMVSGALYLR